MISNTRSNSLWCAEKEGFSRSYLYLFQFLSWTCSVNWFIEAETLWLKSSIYYSNHFDRQTVCSFLFMEFMLLCLENLILNSHLKDQGYFSLKQQSAQPKDRHRQAQCKIDMQCVAVSASSLHPPSWGIARTKSLPKCEITKMLIPLISLGKFWRNHLPSGVEMALSLSETVRLTAKCAK